MQYAENMPIETNGQRLAKNAILKADNWPDTVDVDRRLGEVPLSAAEAVDPVVRYIGKRGAIRFSVVDGYAIYNGCEGVPAGPDNQLRKYRLVEFGGRAGGHISQSAA